MTLLRTRCSSSVPFSCLLLACLLAQASGAATEPKTAEEIQACMEANQPDDTSVQTLGLFATNSIGSTTESRAKMYWKRFEDDLSKVLMRFSDPPDLRSAGMLMIEQKSGRSDMWMYLPELGKTKRISGHMVSGSMFGLDFSWEDFQRIQGLADDSSSKRMPDGDVGGHAVYVVKTTPGPESGSQYESIVEYIDKKTCVMLRSEMFEPGARLRKVFEIDPKRIAPLGDKWYADEILAKDLRDETHTRVAIEKVEVGVEIKRRVFSQRGLESSGR